MDWNDKATVGKADYFPRKTFFEEAQELIATFYSTGDYISEYTDDYASMLTAEGKQDEFYYCLYLLSMLSHASDMIKLIDRVIRNMNPFRVKRRVISTEDFVGEMDMETYIRKNYVEKSRPRVYPSVVRQSTFQAPEYQLVLLILRSCGEIYRSIFKILGIHPQVTAFRTAWSYMEQMEARSTLLQRKYGVAYRRRETYLSLKKKVIYRYRQRKILSGEYKALMRLYEQMISLRGMDLRSEAALSMFAHEESFDDRLFEIWLLRKSAELLAAKKGIALNEIVYTPLYQARKKNCCAVCLQTSEERIEILFQNRKKLLPKEELKWYWEHDGKKEEIGAIPDLIFLKYPAGSEEAEKIVLADAKNRSWRLERDMQRIKGEIVQQIYIRDNFAALFAEEFHSILVAHNIEGYQSRQYYHKDRPGCEISVVSLDISEENRQRSLENYVDGLCRYLEW